MAVAPLAWPDGEPDIKYGRDKARSTSTLGTNEDYFAASGLAIERGRAFTHSEVQHSSQVVLLGQDVVEATFPHTTSLGKTVHLGGVPFVVVGEIARRGKMFGQSQDNVVMIPYTSLGKFYPTFFRKGEYRLKIKPKEDQDIDVAKGEITEVLRRRRHLHARDGDNFVIESDDALLNLYHQLTAGFYVVMMAISSIALMVGGIGVMNIMLVSVKERTREIGIRKALGAKRGDILGQFLLEAATLTGVGGSIGILLGCFVAFLAAKFSPLPAHVAPWSIIAGLGFSVSIGLFFGIYPAWRASKLDPIEALRYE
jgi:putative ABC transport system permease protein